MISVVAHHEVFVRWNQLVLPRRRPVVVIGPSLGKVGLAQHLAVDIDHAVRDMDPLSRERDDPLDKVAARLIRRLEDHDVSALRLMQLVRDLRRDQQVVIVQRPIHTRPEHVHRLHGVLNHDI